MDLTAKVCVVTGASTGIGRRIALDLAAVGARVCVAARRGGLLDDIVADMGAVHDGHSAVVCDVSRRADVERLATHVRGVYGRCDVLVNNAGFSARSRLWEPDGVDVVERVVATNFLGAVRCTRALLPLLEQSAPSHVVNVASVAGRVAVPGASAYCASKFALVGWSEALHYELAARGVFVSLVEPGFVPTEGFPARGVATRPLLRRALSTTDAVSAAVQSVIARRAIARTVPRWYYAAQVARVVAPGLWRAVLRRAAAGATNPARPT